MGIETIALVSAGIGLAGTLATTIPAFINQPKAPKPPQLVKPKVDQELSNTDEKVRRQAAAASGRSSTILTSPLGLDDDTGGAGATLLGG